MAWRYIDQPYISYPAFEEYLVPVPTAVPEPIRPEPPQGFTYQTILNSFTLSELNTHARPFLARVTPWLPLELGAHSKPGGRRVGWREAERERERAAAWGCVRDPRFEWEGFPRTVGWEVRRGWRERQRAERDTAERQQRERQEEEEEEEERDLSGDERFGLADDEDDEGEEQRGQVERENTVDNQDVQVDVRIDFRTSDPRPNEPSAQSRPPPAQRRERPPPAKKQVTWPRILENPVTAPVVESRFEYYCQWFDRFREQFHKIEVAENHSKQDPDYYYTDYDRKPRDSYHGSTTDYEQDARSLEPRAPSSRSKYNPKTDPDYQRQQEEPIYLVPIPKNNAPLIKPKVPRHRQAQPVKSSLLQRTRTKVRDALVSGFGMVVAGVRRGMGMPQVRTPTNARPTTPSAQASAPVPTTAPRIPPNQVTIAVPIARPVSPEEDDKSDTDTERFYTRPASPPSESDEEDAFASLPLRSAGNKIRKRQEKGVPAVTVHTTRSLDVPAPDHDVPVPATHDISAPILPEIGTGAARPMTRDNTAFNAAQLDFIPIPSDRPTRNLPSTATPKQREVALANDKFHQHMAQWETYLRSWAAYEQENQGEVYRPADTWKDVDEDDIIRRDDDERRGRRRRRGPESDGSDSSADERGRRRSRKGKDKETETETDVDADVVQPEDKEHKRLHSPPPENKLPSTEDIEEEDVEDYSNWFTRIQETLKQYDKRYEAEVIDSDDSDAANPDFAGITLDSDLELDIDDIEIPELAAAPLYGSGYNRDRVMPKMRRPDHDRERLQERQRREERRQREDDARRGTRWTSGTPGRRTYGGF